MRQCRNQLNFIKEERKTTEPWFKRIPKFFNDNWGVITQAIGSLTGLSLTMRKCVSEFAKMDDVMANTRKYTGMTDESVRELNEDFKGMNTRTSREQLNEFAGAASFGASPPPVSVISPHFGYGDTDGAAKLITIFLNCHLLTQNDMKF